MALDMVVVREGDAEGANQFQQVTVKVNKEASVKELIEVAAEKVGAGLKAANCILVEVWNGKVYKWFEESTSVDTIRSEDKLLLSEVPDARPFFKSGEQRWGPPSALNSPDEDMDDPSSSSTSSFGVVLHHRKSSASHYVSYIGVPLLMTISKDATVQMLYKQVEQNLKRLYDLDVAVDWKIFRDNNKYSYINDDPQLDRESDQRLQPVNKESRLQFVIEWQDNDLPETLLQEPWSSKCSATADEVDLTHLLQMFVQEEKLSSEDAWYCNRCKEHKEALKKLEFHHCPPVLVLQLKRFQYTRWSRERLDNAVAFPLENLDLTPYCTASSRKTSKVTPVYDLAAVSKHIGSLSGGHYVAFSRSSIDGEWYHFDDSTVRGCTEEEVASDKVGAYVLFYIRRDHRPELFDSKVAD